MRGYIMKNRINSALIGLSMLAIMPVLAEENAGKSSVQTEVLPIVNNGETVKDPKKGFVKEHIQGAVKTIDSGIMSVPYYLGYGVSGIASGLKTVAKYTIGLPFRMAGWGIDGTFGEGTTQGMWNKTSAGLKGSLAAALTFGAYKGINRFAKWINISDIKNAFEQGGEQGDLGTTTDPLKYGSKTYGSLKEFYGALAAELRKRFEYTDLLSYMKSPLKEYKEIILVCDKVEKLIDAALKGNDEYSMDEICALARTKSTGELFGTFNPLKFNILNGYCHDALVLYGKLILAAKLSEDAKQSPQNNSSKLEEESLKHKNILEKLNNRMSKKSKQ
jgi:hypothetical protein